MRNRPLMGVSKVEKELQFVILTAVGTIVGLWLANKLGVITASA